MSLPQPTTKNEKIIFFLSIAVAAWFLFLIIAYELQFGPVWLGVITEMFTIPAIILIPVLFFVAMKQLIKSRFRLMSFSFVTIVLLLLTSLLIILTT